MLHHLDPPGLYSIDFRYPAKRGEGRSVYQRNMAIWRAVMRNE